MLTRWRTSWPKWHQSKTHSAGDAIKVGVCYYIDAPEVITGRNNGCHDLWRIKSNETMKIAYVGPNKGAGLEMPNSKIVFQGKIRNIVRSNNFT